MPLIKYYIVEQTRMVKVQAGNMADALKLASLAFEYGQDSRGVVKITNENAMDMHGIQGNTTSQIEETEINVRIDS